MNNLKKKDLNINILYLWRPSRFFWALAISSFIVWLLLGPIWWRHVDDFGPIQFFIKRDCSFWDSYQLLDGFGSYPPIWSLWTAISYFFKIIGLTETRYILLIQGFITAIISAYLTICVSLKIISNSTKKNSNIKIEKYIPFIVILAIAFNLFNPEIMLHSITYMPYNLSTITTLSLLLLILSSQNNFQFSPGGFPLHQIKFSFSNLLFLAYVSLFFSFQSIILLIGILITKIYCRDINNTNFLNLGILNINLNKIFKFSSFNCFSKINLLIDFLKLFLLYLPISYIYKFLILLKRSTRPGSWANGLDNVYDLTFGNYQFFEWILKCFKNTSSIIGQAIYPFRIFQDEAAILLSIFIVFSLIFIDKFKNSGKVFLINMSFVFIISILLATFGNFIYSPTRHTIFLYPYIWILLILIFFGIHIQLSKLFENFGPNCLVYLSLIIFFTSIIGLVNSHNQIQYTKEDRYKLVNMAKDSDYFIDDIYLLEGVSLFSSHGSIEMESVHNKKCTLKKINGQNKIKFFSYNHRYPLNIKTNKNHLQELIKRSNGCISSKDKVKIINKFEKKNKLDIEQNNRIYNGGSNIYAYVIEVSKEN